VRDAAHEVMEALGAPASFWESEAAHWRQSLRIARLLMGPSPRQLAEYNRR
jgi:hypothetical protein